MAEAFGIVGSAASLAGLLKQMLQTYDLYSTLKDAPDAVQSIATNIAVFRSTLDNSIRCSQQLEDLGCDAEEYRSSFQEAVKWLEKVKETVEQCMPEAEEGKGAKTRKRLKYLVKKKKIADQLAGFERMNLNTIEARINLESSLQQKQYIGIQASNESIRTLSADFGPKLLDLQAKTDLTNKGIEQLRNDLSNTLHPEKAGTQAPKQEPAKGVQSPGKTIHIQAPSASPTTLQSKSGSNSILEEFATKPFHLVVVCIFLNRTSERTGMPAAQSLLQQYPTPKLLAEAQFDDIKPFFEHLGLLSRAKWLIDLAKDWLVRPPQASILYTKGKGQSVLSSEVAHFKGVGPFASDAWRIFCKDDLYRQAGYPITVPEWKKVSPKHKGLTAYLRHRWDEEGFVGDPSNSASPRLGSRPFEEETKTSTNATHLINRSLLQVS